MPMPMIVTSGGIPAVTELPVLARAPVRDSRRIPAIFLPPTSTSFGHLSLVSTRATRRSASATATAVVSDKVESSDCGRRGRTMIEASRLVPAEALQVLPRRPRPASCWSATTTVRSAAPRSASAKATDWVESTVPRRTMTPGALLPGIVEPAEARDELGVQRFLLDEPLPLLCDDLGGRALGEVRLRQLALQELDALGGLGDLLLDPLALGGEVHDAREVYVELRAADDGHRRAPWPRRGRVDGEPDPAQRVDQRAVRGEEISRVRPRAKRRRERGGGPDPHLAADVSHGGGEVHDRSHLDLCVRLRVFLRRTRVRREHDRLALVRQPLPDLLSDERHERMQEPQGRREHANQGRLRARTLAGVLGVIAGQLRDLQIPVAALVPQELVQHEGAGAEPVCH